MYICLCKSVTDSQINDAIKDGASCMRDLNRQLGVGSSCGQCCRHACQLLKQNAKPLTINQLEAVA